MKSRFPILLVDDEEIILATIGRDLRNEGFNVTTCKSGDEAVKQMQLVNYDIILTDLMMEGISGIEVLRKAKEINPDAMVMVITGFGSLSSAVDALRLGASDYLLKPCDRRELSMRVNNCVEKLDLKRRIKAYENILPICSVCNKIRDDEDKKGGTGDWLSVEDFLKKRAHLTTTHGYCPSCIKKTEGDIDEFLTHKIDINVDDLDP